MSELASESSTQRPREAPTERQRGSAMSIRGTHRSGARPARAATPRRPWWLWLLIAILIIAGLMVALLRCGTDAGPAGPPTMPGAGAATTPTGPAPGAAQGPGAGTLTAGDTPLLPVAAVAGPDGSLAGFVGRPVTATDVVVRSVAADEGFWVGGGGSDRVWVQLTGAGESAYSVAPGDRVSFTGRVVGHDTGFAAQVGVDPAEGAEQLTGQAAHVAVAQADLQLTKA
jgi:hypothetical protein